MASVITLFLAQSADAGFMTSFQWIMLGLIVVGAGGLIALIFKMKPSA